MTTELIIQLFSVIISTVSIIVTVIYSIKSLNNSNKQAQQQRENSFYAEYTRRYQDIFMNMPDDIYNGTVEIDERTKRYIRVYYNLCSEEYQLWQKGFVKKEVWGLWVGGMQIETNHKIFHDAWNALKERIQY